MAGIRTLDQKFTADEFPEWVQTRPEAEKWDLRDGVPVQFLGDSGPVVDPGPALVIHHSRVARDTSATRFLHERAMMRDPPGLSLEGASLYP